MVAKVVHAKEVVLRAGHPIVHQVLVHAGLKPSAVVQIEREKAHLVACLREPDRQRLLGMVVLGAFAIERTKRPDGPRGSPHGQHIRFDDVLQRRDERLISSALFVPPAELGRRTARR